jgi:hypothetical protein
MGWKIVSFFMLCAIAALAIWLVIVVLNLPGKLARERKHPQVSAIEAAAWLGLVTGMVTWVVAFIWACTVPVVSTTAEEG